MIKVTRLGHVNVTVPLALEAATRKFYGEIMGLQEVPKPAASKGRGGAWYQLGAAQLHLSREEAVDNSGKRHICYVVADLIEAERHFREAGVEIIPDSSPIAGSPRFNIRDPGGNLIEIAEETSARGGA